MPMSQCTRREFLAGAAGVAAPLGAAQQRPNILFIMADEMRWDAMSSEENPVVATQNLDALGRAGVRSSRSYTGSPVRAGASRRDLSALDAPALWLPHRHRGQTALCAAPFQLRLRPVLVVQRRRPHAGTGLHGIPAEETRLAGEVSDRAGDVSVARRPAGPRRWTVQVSD